VDKVSAANAAGQHMADRVFAQVAERRRSPRDDLLSALIQAEEEGDRLSEIELLATVLLLYIAGHETTVNLIGNGLLALLRHPDQRRAWIDDPSLDANAVDELLRFDSPVQVSGRFPLDDVELGGVTMAKGETVLTILAAANHDPDVFAEPERLDLRRANAGRHMAFGGGAHYCLGANLARAEAQVALGTIVRRLPTIELAGEPVWRDTFTLRGLTQLPIAW
jgi:cytochrome P450